MKYLNKLLTVLCSAVLGLIILTGCEGADLYTVNSPNWLNQKIDSIAEAKAGEVGPLYTFGQTDFSSGWWADFSKYYVIPEGEIWEATFNLHINPSATNTYKNFALIICSDAERGGRTYKEYGAIRYDNQPSGNSEWGDYIDRSLVESTLTFETDTDAGVDKLGGMVTLTVDRSNGGLIVTITNGVVTKTYTQTSPLENLNADATNTNIRCFLVVEGSYIDFWTTNIDAFDENAEHQPLSMELSGVPSEVLVGTTLEEAMANGNKQAKLALDIFHYKVAQYIASYMVSLGGCDAITFAGGVGERGIYSREEICKYLKAFGAELDLEANQVKAEERKISTDNSKIELWIVPTNEELFIAKDTEKIVNG